jgi:nucleotide-binding universal stress UspA family protein
MHIQLYSVKGFTGDALRDKLSRALAEQHIENEIIEINSVAQFVRDGIPSVPAIQIGRKVFLHNPHATLEETVDRVMEYIQKGQTPSILVPVDFSEESLHAVEFAAVVADGLEMDLTLTHIHVPIYDPVSGGACDVLWHQDQQAELNDLAARMTTENK